jgi:hypothetical protein
VYHLFAYDGKTKEYTYVNIAYIGTRPLSVYMNKLFRNIRENDNVDYGEESEDEDTFQNVNPDKYVDLKKEYKMSCVFNNKFKKWVPDHVVDSRCVNINDLMFQNQSKPSSNYSSNYSSKPSSNYSSKPSSNYLPNYSSKPSSNYSSNPYINKRKLYSYHIRV